MSSVKRSRGRERELLVVKHCQAVAPAFQVTQYTSQPLCNKLQ